MLSHLKTEIPLAIESKATSQSNLQVTWVIVQIWKAGCKEWILLIISPSQTAWSPRTASLEHSRSQLVVGKAAAQAKQFHQAHADLAQIVSLGSWILHGIESSSIIITRSIRSSCCFLPTASTGQQTAWGSHHLTMPQLHCSVHACAFHSLSQELLPAHLPQNMVWKFSPHQQSTAKTGILLSLNTKELQTLSFTETWTTEYYRQY